MLYSANGIIHQDSIFSVLEFPFIYVLISDILWKSDEIDNRQNDIFPIIYPWPPPNWIELYKIDFIKTFMIFSSCLKS